MKARGEGCDRGLGGWMASLTQWMWVWASLRMWDWVSFTLETVKDREAWHCAVHGVAKSRHDLATEQQ